jgi:hypothetical protein
MAELEKVIKWLEYDYLPRVGAYRKDCKQGCDACMPMHDGDDYCDIDMLCKILALLKEQEAVAPYQHDAVWLCGNCEKEVVGWDDDIDGKEYRYPFCRQCGQAVKW